MKALVSGSAGFIGRHLIETLTERGYRVTGVDRQSVAPSSGTEHVTLDLADETRVGELAELARDADIVFHLAARPGVRESGPVVEEMRRRDNVEATRRLLSVIPPGIPVVATSSSSVYGGSVRPTGSRETDPLYPRGGYARSKVAMELVCEQYRSRGGVVAVLRPFTVAGEGQRCDMAFSMWLEALRRGEPIRIFGSENRSRDITDIRDAVEGLIRAGEREVNETVNLGTGVGHRLIDMARALIDVSGITGEIVRSPVMSEEVDVTLADPTRCSERLGFIPSTDLSGLLARQVAADTPLPMLVAT